MVTDVRYQVDWSTAEGALRLYEPTPAEVLAAAPTLAAFYNEPHNRAMLTNTRELSPAEVFAHYAEQRQAGNRPFLLARAGELLGDADLRGFTPEAAELAILVGARHVQGQGLGRRFALMAHALAFGPLERARLYAAIIPENGPSRRLFAWLGYLPDDGPAARACADEESDLTFSVAREAFLAQHGAALADLRIAPRGARR